MFERERRLYELMLQLCLRMSADIEEAQLTHQPATGIKPPLWILGHLTICTDYASRILGVRMVCPKAWHANFGRGSQNQSPADVRPTKDELIEALKAGHHRVAEATLTAKPEELEEPHGVDFFQGSPLLTRADVLAHLMTTHESLHLGQLSTWRRQMGFEPLM